MEFKQCTAVILLVFLSACSNNNAGINTNQNVYDHSPSEQLAEAASSASKSMLNIAEIQQATGYQLKVLGHPPAIPVMVYVSTRNQMIGDTLRDVAFQAHRRTHIIVYPSTKIVELRYITTRA